MASKFLLHLNEIIAGGNAQDIEFVDLDDQVSNICDIMTNIVRTKGWSPKRGDVIWITDYKYRNDGRYFWDGHKVIPQEYEPDDYGMVPKEFTCPDFKPSHWETVENHNAFVWLKINDQQKAECLANITDGPVPELGLSNNVVYTTFLHNNQKNYILALDDTLQNLTVDQRKALLSNNIQNYDPLLMHNFLDFENIIGSVPDGKKDNIYLLI